MNARLLDLRRQLGDARRRLDEWARRLSDLRARVTGGRPSAEAPPVGAPLFHAGPGAGPLDDVELNFEVLDTEDPGRGRS